MYNHTVCLWRDPFNHPRAHEGELDFVTRIFWIAPTRVRRRFTTRANETDRPRREGGSRSDAQRWGE